ncbi:membrane protein [Agarivorans sp. Toyoura001]|uniref:anthrone oxygenase family protein n=1 Tax=Agarivorans sp. Toyoura001 TaxID=2283141 RepID=UPI0010F2B649|nr:anthrone oxygenase family protein [Agarivorans sp. Toyoura001]GDY24879.1 membrane protein [Agarivorans sp. Toyoura001]
MTNVEYFLLLLAAITSGVVAGIFFAFSNFVMPALARLTNEQGLAAMQSINVTVLNPGFFMVFIGSALLSLASLTWQFTLAVSINYYAVAASLSYLIGCFAVTALANVPRNNALALISRQTALSSEDAQYWRTYLQSWTAWNHIRTVASAMAMLLFIFAL